MNRNSTVIWTLALSDGTTVTRKCRNSLGSYAKMVDKVQAETGFTVDPTRTVQGLTDADRVAA